MPATDNIIVYGTTWCGDCRRARAVLDRLQVSYHWVDIDRDEEAARLVEKLNTGLRQGAGFARKLVLISAPAGFGKTTLAADWLGGAGLRVAVALSGLELQNGQSYFISVRARNAAGLLGNVSSGAPVTVDEVAPSASAPVTPGAFVNRSMITWAWTESTDETMLSFVNGIPTGSGGTHEMGFKAGVNNAVRDGHIVMIAPLNFCRALDWPPFEGLA
ncbi:MAG: hypothetical protein HGA82_04035, partial [Anaerolineales bacterium]|nr:hypothetical protein [Anaerolineales bacterium]